jgi:hypothetical protein
MILVVCTIRLVAEFELYTFLAGVGNSTVFRFGGSIFGLKLGLLFVLLCVALCVCVLCESTFARKKHKDSHDCHSSLCLLFGGLAIMCATGLATIVLAFSRISSGQLVSAMQTGTQFALPLPY